MSNPSQKLQSKLLARAALPILLGMFLLVGVLWFLPADIPVSVQASAPPVAVLNSADIATDTTWVGYSWPNVGGIMPKTVDIYLSYTAPTTATTTTFYLDTSPDGNLWLAHNEIPALWTDVVTTTDAYTTVTIAGWQYRIRAVVANTETITPKLWVVSH
jgi:hypothetical protein